MNEYADTLLAQRISMVSGVSRVQVYGAQKYAVRVQVDPDELAARNIGIDEVQQRHSSEQHQPAHRPPGRRQAGVHHPIERHADRTPPPTGRMIVAWRNGSPVRLEQLGNVIDSVENDKVIGWFNNTRAVILAIQRQPGTNTVEVVDSIKALLPQFRREIPPAVNLAIAFDASESIRGSIHDVEFTLLLTICLVVMVIFLFLRNLSATLIPGVRRAVLDRRHVRRDVPAGLQPQQPVADGADAVGGLRGGRRHRDAGEHRAPHGDGQDRAWRPRWTPRARSGSRSSR